ncbi:hypothetical protein P8C59_001459 [Phyllachora maydis]|uniref:DASH complex subunit DAD4 n=1 Tax=Phyllachora maydis TaxID=1825666 RepID=A0AAD9HZS9_9PEZI|nr:hypothetical protein P8C59_001459 [Phyllachora maydis]
MPSQRTVLITGCSDGGLGSYLALAFHQAGWRVFASGRNLSKLSKATAAGIETVQLDTLSDDSIAGAVAAVKKSTGGHLDALVNNAGAAHSMPLMDLDISKARELFDLNVFSLISVTRAFLPLLLNSSYERGALVVNNTSIASQTRGALPFEGAYSASKAAAGSLTEVMRLELQPFGIRVINLVTGGVRTNLFSNAPSVELPPESLFNVAKEAVEKAMWAGSGANMDRLSVDNRQTKPSIAPRMESPHEHQQNLLLSRIITNVEKLNEAVVAMNKSLQEINIQNMNVELVAQMFKNYQSNVLFHLEATDNLKDPANPEFQEISCGLFPLTVFTEFTLCFNGRRRLDPSIHDHIGLFFYQAIERVIHRRSSNGSLCDRRHQDKRAIVIDNGSSAVRAGWSFEQQPRIIIPPIMAKYRDRKLGKTFSFAGNDCYADTTAKGHIRNAFEVGTGIVSNWDVMEHVLDHLFIKLGMNGVEGGIDMPIVMTEAIANLPYSRKSMTEIIFECYRAPGLVYGIDSLFSYRHNQGNTGLVVSSSYSATHVIPVYNLKPMLGQAIRLNWGGCHAAEYLLKLVKLKYPGFPGKLNLSQAEEMVRDFCYVSKDYATEVAGYLDWSGLEDRERIIQYPYTEEVIVQKTEEELARIAERKKESGRRLQEQAAKMRLERLLKKEQELEYYRDVQRRLVDQNKKETRRILDDAEVKDETQLERIIKDLERSIKKARQKDLGGEQEEEEQEAPDFSLLDVPDDQLDEAGLKQKKLQRLMKSNHDARARAKAEKEAEKARKAEEERIDLERRTNDLEGWVEKKRQLRLEKLAQIKDRDRLKADLGNRKSLASQMRMKSLANLASDNPASGRKRRRGGDDDDFGADDADWGVYRSVAIGANKGDSDDEEEEEDLDAAVRSLEQDLLEYDADFTYENTLEAQKDWTKSLLHAFRYGPRPHDPASPAETHRIHLNVERIRVPEVIFQPHAIAGIDQAGLVEIAGDVLNQRLTGLGVDRDLFLRDVFLTGGNTLFPNFDQRLRNELTALLPAGAPLRLRRAGDSLLDAWKGAAGWVGTPQWREAVVTRDEYLEKGSEYFKEHNMGNAFG